MGQARALPWYTVHAGVTRVMPAWTVAGLIDARCAVHACRCICLTLPSFACCCRLYLQLLSDAVASVANVSRLRLVNAGARGADAGALADALLQLGSLRVLQLHQVRCAHQCTGLLLCPCHAHAITCDPTRQLAATWPWCMRAWTDGCCG